MEQEKIECLKKAIAEHYKLEPCFIQLDTDLFKLGEEQDLQLEDIYAIYVIAEDECGINIPHEIIVNLPTLRRIINYVDTFLTHSR